MPATQTVEPPTIEFTAPQPQTMPAVRTELPPAPIPAEPQPTTMLDIIDRASRDPSVNIDKLERLIAMKVQMENRQAQMEFDSAMVTAQEAMRAISPDKENNQTHSRYATYAALDQAVRPIYSAHGFALSFNTGDAPNPNEVRVMCTVSHREGHRQDYKIDMPADGKGPQGAAVMTRTHATGAAASYGQRYLLKLIFNLAVGDVDDDGNGAGGDYSQDDDVESLAPANAPRDANGKLLSQYSADRAAKAKDWADSAISCINHGNAQQAQHWRDEQSQVPKGKRKSPLEWLKDNSPGQYLRVRQAYQNNTGEDLE